MQEKINQISDNGDYLTYGDIDKKTAIEYIDILIKYLVQQKNDAMKETILGIILDTEDFKEIDKELDISPIVTNLDKFNIQCLSYVLSILSYSGKKEYMDYIESFNDEPRLKEDIEEAIYILNY